MNDNNLNQEDQSIAYNPNNISKEEIEQVLNSLESNSSNSEIKTKKGKKDSNEKATLFLVISIINFLITSISGGVFLFIILMGALSGSTAIIYGLIGFTIGYIVASIVALIASIINKIAKGKILKPCLIAILIAFIAGMSSTYFIFHAEEFKMKNNNAKTKIVEGKIIYEDDDMIVKQKKIEYEQFKIKFYFEIQTNDVLKDITYTTGRINHCTVNSLLINKYENNIYYLEIPYSQLKNYNIKEIESIQFTLNGKSLKIQLKDEKIDMIKTIGLKDSNKIYESDYYVLYLVNRESYSQTDLYIQSLTDKNYTLNFTNLDFDTPGYGNNIQSVNLSDYSITKATIYYGSYRDNVSYIKYDYKIGYYDEEAKKHIDVVKDTVDIKYSSPKIPKKKQ